VSSVPQGEQQRSEGVGEQNAVDRIWTQKNSRNRGMEKMHK